MFISFPGRFLSLSLSIFLSLIVPPIFTHPLSFYPIRSITLPFMSYIPSSALLYPLLVHPFI